MSKLNQYGLIIKEQKKHIQDLEVKVDIYKHEKAVADSQRIVDGNVPSGIQISPEKEETPAAEVVHNEGDTGAAKEFNEVNDINELENIDFNYNAGGQSS